MCARLFYNRSGIKYRRKKRKTLKEAVTETTDAKDGSFWKAFIYFWKRNLRQHSIMATVQQV